MDASKNGCVPSGSGGNGNSCLIDIAAGQAGYVGLDEVKLLAVIPSFFVDDPTPSPADIPDSVSLLNNIEGCQL